MEITPLLSELVGCAVTPERVLTLPGDASSRRYHRVWLPAGCSPARLIVMELPADALASDEAVSGSAPDELPFVNLAHHMSQAGLRVPAILLDATDRGALLLEDLGDETFVRRIEAEPQSMEAWYLAAVELLCQVHRSMWPIPVGCLAADRRFDRQLLRWELDHYREWGAEALAGSPLEPALRERLDRELDALTDRIVALPTGFVHRDYQSRNLMVVGDRPSPSSLAIIDFQDALAGPRVYDLVALLNDSYMEVPEPTKERVIGRYAELGGIDAAQLRREFDLVTVQRKLKDGGRFVFIDRVKGNPAFLPFVDTSFGRVRAALDRLPDLDGLRAALAQVDPVRFG